MSLLDTVVLVSTGSTPVVVVWPVVRLVTFNALVEDKKLMILQHHHRTNLDKYHPGYFGKVGMRHFHLLRNHDWKPTINVDKVYTTYRF
jgi:hypothetical protein